MNDYYYCVSLRITHPFKDLENLSEILGKEPTRSWAVGEPRQTPKGTTLEGVYKYNSWNAPMHSENYLYSTDVRIEDFLCTLNQSLEKYKDMFEEIASTGGRIEYFIGWFSDGNIGMELRPEILKSSAELNMTIALDVYANKDS